MKFVIELCVISILLHLLSPPNPRRHLSESHHLVINKSPSYITDELFIIKSRALLWRVYYTYSHGSFKVELL